MLIIKATQTTLVDMNVKPAKVEVNDLFLSWHVNYFKLFNKKHYIFMNDLSRLSITVSGIRKNEKVESIQKKFLQELGSYLLYEGISETLIDYYLENCKEVNVTKTDSRSVRGTLSEIMLVMNSIEANAKDLEEMNQRHKWMNKFIYSSIDYKYPIEVFGSELNARINQ